jgi:hypothetical protein
MSSELEEIKADIVVTKAELAIAKQKLAEAEASGNEAKIAKREAEVTELRVLQTKQTGVWENLLLAGTGNVIHYFDTSFGSF